MIDQPLYASDPSRYYKPVHYEELTVDGAVRTPTVPAGCRMAKAYFRGGNVRITLHSVDPTSSLGVPFYDGYEEYFSLRELEVMRLIREGSTNGTVHFIYYN